MFDFLSVRKTAQAVQSRIDELRGQLTTIKRMRAEAVNAAASKADLKALVEMWVQEKGSEFNRLLTGRLKMYQSRVAAEVIFHPQNRDGLQLMGIGAADTRSAYRNEPAMPADLDVVMCALFGPQVKKAMCDVIDAMEWPNEGLPLARRKAELSKLDDEEASVVRSIDELFRQAEEAGLDVS